MGGRLSRATVCGELLIGESVPTPCTGDTRTIITLEHNKKILSNHRNKYEDLFSEAKSSQIKIAVSSLTNLSMHDSTNLPRKLRGGLTRPNMPKLDK